MNKEEGAKMVVVGGKSDVTQQYCGTVGGQSTDFSTIDTEVKVSTSSAVTHDYLFWSADNVLLNRRQGLRATH